MSDFTHSDGAKFDALMNSDDTRTISEIKAADTDFTEEVIKEARRCKGGWDITSARGTGFMLTDKRNTAEIEPKVGMLVRVYGQIGQPFYGVDLDGEQAFFDTPAERLAARIQWLADYDRRKREELESGAEKRAKNIESLSPQMRERIDKFAAEDPKFWLETGDYELFCCTEADKFAAAARDAVESGDNAEDVDQFWADPEKVRDASHGDPWEEPKEPEVRWLWWAKALNSKAYDYQGDFQKSLLGAEDGHSGNTFGGAISLATYMLANPAPTPEGGEGE